MFAGRPRSWLDLPQPTFDCLQQVVAASDIAALKKEVKRVLGSGTKKRTVATVLAELWDCWQLEEQQLLAKLQQQRQQAATQSNAAQYAAPGAAAAGGGAQQFAANMHQSYAPQQQRVAARNSLELQSACSSPMGRSLLLM